MNIEDIARYYISAPAYQVPDCVKSNFREFIVDLAQVELHGIDIHYVDVQPYFRGSKLSLEDLCADINQGRLQVSSQFNESNLLSPELNLIFRSIHDLHHAKLQVDFNWQGECASTCHILSLTDDCLFQQLLFSEILGQSAVCLYTGKFPDYQKVVLFELDVLRSVTAITSN